MKEALLLVDIQNDYFENGAFPLPHMSEASQRAVDVLAWARETGRKVIHIQHEEGDPEEGFLVQGTEGAKINTTVSPKPGEEVVVKNYPNAFRDTSLLGMLEGVGRVLIVGAMSNMCVDATARAAFDAGFEVTIVEDACAACDLEFKGEDIPAAQVHGAFMAALASAYGIVTTSGELIKKA